MTDLERFLQQNVEGYLFNDLRAMQPTTVGYPLVMSSFAGIELLGALVSSTPFDTNSGPKYFDAYWSTYLYPKVKDSSEMGSTLYKFVRHGLAHLFVLKGPIGIVKNKPALHLSRDPNSGLIRVDAVELANDLMDSYTQQIVPLITATTGTVTGASMSERLAELRAKYQSQSAGISASVFPTGTVTQSASISQSAIP